MAGKTQPKTNRLSENAVAPPPAVPPPSKLLPFLEQRHLVLMLALILVASLRIVATYPVFNHTSDEPAHVACGIEWLANGAYTWEPQHPPLARVAVALGPYLFGARPANTPRKDIYSMTQEGVSILFQGHHYDRTMVLARLGVLPFFWAGCLVVYFWGKRYYGAPVGVVAVFLFSFLPVVLAHAGLATTDMPLTAFLGAAFFSCLVWAATPTLKKGAFFGACTGLALLCKFSTLAYFPVGVGLVLLGYLIVERPKPGAAFAAAVQRIPSLGLGILVACLLIWAVYRFSFGPTSFGMRLPAPELFAGVAQVIQHNNEGHPSFLLGQMMLKGVWYYFPLLLSIKTPLGFLLLLAIGAVAASQPRARVTEFAARTWVPLAFSAGILLVALFSHINIGLRHILPIYVGFAVFAALGAVRLLERANTARWAGAAVAIPVLWLAASSLLSHPDYLPYFNELAGDHPENIVVDSDLDWGQDMKRLAKRLNEEHATSFAMLPFLIDLPPGAFGLPPMVDRIDAMNPFPGWNAVSLTILKVDRLGLARRPELTPWPERAQPPTERIGKGLELWYFPPANR